MANASIKAAFERMWQYVVNALNNKSDISHNHNDVYYTESEIDNKISAVNTSITNITNGTTKVGKATSADNATSATSATKATQDGNGNVITSTYETKTDASAKLTEAKTYADSAANKVKNDLLNGAGAAYDTLKELGELIDDNKDAIDALEDIASGKANAVHIHAIADVSGLQTALDGKAASSHGTHVSYSTTAPVMDGTASVGSASTVARSDHKHPTDTSRASKTEFDTHVSDTTKHITSTERTNWGAAYTHSTSAHAPSNAEKNQNAFSNIKVGTTTIAADTTTDTLELVGSNVTITPDATNDKVTIAVADGTTSAKGVVQLTNSTSSTSTTTAATPSSVKSAYDLASAAQTRADSAYDLANSKADSLSDLGITATATELNYVDGVTSNVQTQLDGKAPTTHNHNASNITSGTLSSDRLPAATSSALGGVKIGSNINISSGTISVPTADGTTAGVTVVYPADSCTTFTSDAGTVTPKAVQKAAKQFAITRPDSSTNKAITRYSNTTGDVQDSKIIIEDVTNTKDSSKKAQVIAIPAEGGKKMVYGYCTDQVDGTSFIGGVFDASATAYPYSAGLAIGGTSGNLLWKGARVLDNNDLTTLNTAINGKANSSHGTHVSYGTSATAVGATASAGSATTVSRSDHTHSLSKSAVTTALGYTPPTSDTNTTYTFATGDSNGQIKVTPSGGSAQNVAVKGLGTAAYTASTAYATAAQGTLASNAMPKSGGQFTDNISFVNGKGIDLGGIATGVFIALNNSGIPCITWTDASGNRRSWTLPNTMNSVSNAMPKSGGTFTGNTVAIMTNREGGCIRNITVQNSEGTANVSTNYIIMRRK